MLEERIRSRLIARGWVESIDPKSGRRCWVKPGCSMLSEVQAKAVVSHEDAVRPDMRTPEAGRDD